MKTFRTNEWTPLPRGVLFALFVLLASPLALAAAPQPVERQVHEEFGTVHGKFEVYRLNFEDSSYQYQLALDGKVFSTLSVDQLLFIEAKYPEKDPVRVVLLRLPTGGSGCPARYKIVEIKDDGSTLQTKVFGNCSNDVRSSFKEGVLRVDVSNLGGAKAESWLYQNGKLTKAPRSSRK